MKRGINQLVNEFRHAVCARRTSDGNDNQNMIKEEGYEWSFCEAMWRGRKKQFTPRESTTYVEFEKARRGGERHKPCPRDDRRNSFPNSTSSGRQSLADLLALLANAAC
jgi:hypothetical protein